MMVEGFRATTTEIQAMKAKQKQQSIAAYQGMTGSGKSRYVSKLVEIEASEMTDELRPEYKRSDFGEIVRGKYANRIKEETNVVLLEPDIAEAFPNDEAVNKALRYLLEVAKTSTSLTQRSSGLR